MGNRDDDWRDRDKKTLSELDKMRRERRPDASRTEGERPDQRDRSNAYRAYKSQLDKVFEGGGLPPSLQAKLGDTGPGKGAKAKKKALAAITGATTPAEIASALAEYRERFGFPEEAAALGRVLELDTEPALVLEALRTIERLLGEGALQSGRSLAMRIKAAMMTVDDDDAVALAKQLLARL